MKTSYKCLKNQKYTIQDFSLVPIRWEDRYKIMEWRNEQIFHLRQHKELTAEDQDEYFKNVISTLFYQNQPKQILFSFLKDNRCIGYGGLVHINWIDKNAEISFIMDTKLENKFFNINWLKFIKLIEDIGFNSLKFKKLYVYAFDVRPNLYKVLEKSFYFLEARLKSHCKINKTYKDVVIYSKIK
jgi:RimJ/RimL family protein N-acetyltransferase